MNLFILLSVFKFVSIITPTCTNPANRFNRPAFLSDNNPVRKMSLSRIYPANVLFILDNSFQLDENSLQNLINLITEVFMPSTHAIEQSQKSNHSYFKPNQIVIQSCSDRTIPATICDNVYCLDELITKLRNANISRNNDGLESCLDSTRNHWLLNKWGNDHEQASYPQFVIFVGDGVHGNGQTVKAAWSEVHKKALVLYYVLDESYRNRLGVSKRSFEANHMLIIQMITQGDRNRIFNSTNAEQIIQQMLRVICKAKISSTGCFIATDNRGDRHCQGFSYFISDTKSGDFVETCEQMFGVVRFEPCSPGQCRCEDVNSKWIQGQCQVSCGEGYGLWTRNSSTNYLCRNVVVPYHCSGPPCNSKTSKPMKNSSIPAGISSTLPH